ncbi:MAG: sugar transferase [Actinomycetota bacterium]
MSSPSDTIRLKSRLAVRPRAESRPAAGGEDTAPTTIDLRDRRSDDSELFDAVEAIDLVDPTPATVRFRPFGLGRGRQTATVGVHNRRRSSAEPGHRSTPDHSPPIRLDPVEPTRAAPTVIPEPATWTRITVRAFDIAVALVGLVLLAPLMTLVALAVVIDSPGPVFYGSPRLGHRRSVFKAWKFRSMRPGAERELEELLADDPTARDEYLRYHKLRRDPRLTRVGMIIRQGSLDELPQLINILLGQMSVVGPRPKLLRDAEAYGEHLEAVLSVKPGLTGLWQVSGRNRLPMADRVALDLQYVRDRTLLGDVAICVRTFVQLWRPRKHGAY